MNISGQSCKKIDEMFSKTLPSQSQTLNKEIADASNSKDDEVINSACTSLIPPSTSVDTKYINLITNDNSSETVTTIEQHTECSMTETVDCEEIEDFNFYVKPKPKDLKFFIKYHPQQNVKDAVIQKAFYRKDNTIREWLTCSENKILYCWLCLAFVSDKNLSDPFVTGFNDRKHIHQRVDQHEKSQVHKDCFDAFRLKQQNLNLKQVLCTNDNSLRNVEVKKTGK